MFRRQRRLHGLGFYLRRRSAPAEPPKPLTGEQRESVLRAARSFAERLNKPKGGRRDRSKQRDR